MCTDDLDEPESEAYYFRVTDGNPVDCHTCPADFNCSGMVSVQDIFDFLGAYFTPGCAIHNATPGNTGPCFLGADINSSGSASVQDVFDFLAHWFGGC